MVIPFLASTSGAQDQQSQRFQATRLSELAPWSLPRTVGHYCPLLHRVETGTPSKHRKAGLFVLQLMPGRPLLPQWTNLGSLSEATGSLSEKDRVAQCRRSLYKPPSSASSLMTPPNPYVHQTPQVIKVATLFALSQWKDLSIAKMESIKRYVEKKCLTFSIQVFLLLTQKRQGTAFLQPGLSTSSALRARHKQVLSQDFISSKKHLRQSNEHSATCHRLATCSPPKPGTFWGVGVGRPSAFNYLVQ